MWVYLHLPAKWLGGRKPLGWGAWPYGDGAGWPEPIQAERKDQLLNQPYTWHADIQATKESSF